MRRFAISLTLVLAVAFTEVHGQESGSRYVPFPFEGNFEALFKARLQSAKRDAPLHDLLTQIQQNPQKFNLNPATLKGLDLENPALREMLRNMADKHFNGEKFTPLDLAGLQKVLDNKGQHLPTSLPPLPKESLTPPHFSPNPGEPNKLPKPPDLLDRWIRDLAQQAQNTPLGDWLSDSPAFNKGIGDLKALVNLENTSQWGWGLDNLPDHLRLADKLDWRLSEGFWSRLPDVSLPDLPRVNLPEVHLGEWFLPSVSLPNVDAPAGVKIGETLLWAVVIVIGLVLFWQIVSKHQFQWPNQTSTKTLGSWPVDPAHVATRSQLIEAFDYLALLKLGQKARSWNHRAIARQLVAATSNTSAVEELTGLYEQARYTIGPDPLSPSDQSAARRHLCLLAGVNPS